MLESEIAAAMRARLYQIEDALAAAVADGYEGYVKVVDSVDGQTIRWTIERVPALAGDGTYFDVGSMVRQTLRA